MVAPPPCDPPLPLCERRVGKRGFFKEKMFFYFLSFLNFPCNCLECLSSYSLVPIPYSYSYSYSPLPIPYALFPTHYSLLLTAYFLLPLLLLAPYSPLPTPYFLLPTAYSLLPTAYSLLATPYSLLPTPTPDSPLRLLLLLNYYVCS